MRAPVGRRRGENEPLPQCERRRSIVWYGIVLVLCAWTLFRGASDIRLASGVPYRRSAGTMLTIHPASSMDCLNAGLRPLFRPRGNHSYSPSFVTGGSTASQPTNPSHTNYDEPDFSMHRNSSRRESSGVWEILHSQLEGAGGRTQGPSSARRKVLVVVPGLGETDRMNRTVNSLETLRETVEDPDGFACIVYVYDVDVLEEADARVGHLCQVVLNFGMWTSHMKKVPPLTNSLANESTPTDPPFASSLRRLAENVTHVAIMMDDIDVADLDMSRFLSLMDFTGFGVASPAFGNEYYHVMRRRCECVYHRTDFVNVMFAVFTRRVWQCWQSLVDPISNRYGWGMDIALARRCNTTSGILDVFDAHHRGSGRIYSTEEASKQMVAWLVKHANVKKENEKRYRDCVTTHRPEAVFPKCELYWDGSHHPDEAHALAPDWDCASLFQR